MKIFKSNIHKLSLSIALIGTVMVGQSAWACEKPNVSGYDYVDGCLSEGLVGVKKNGKWGFIDKTGKIIIEPQYHYVASFSEGLAVVKQNGKYGFIDKTGKVVIPLQYDGVDSFSEGLAVVRQNNKWGYIDTNGKTIIDLKYSLTMSFKNGKAKVQSNDDKTPQWFYIDKTGKALTTRTSLADFRKKLEQGDDVSFLDNGVKQAMIIEIKGNLVQVQTKERYSDNKWVKKSEVYPTNHFD